MALDALKQTLETLVRGREDLGDEFDWAHAVNAMTLIEVSVSAFFDRVRDAARAADPEMPDVENPLHTEIDPEKVAALIEASRRSI